MGSPASPVIANVFMIKLEQKALESFEHPPKTWQRFVDDIFTIVKRSQVKNLLPHLNKQHPNISFTVEEEQDNKLPYMDITVHRIGNKLHTDVYRKPTHTELQLKPHRRSKEISRLFPHRPSTLHHSTGNTHDRHGDKQDQRGPSRKRISSRICSKDD